MDGEEGLDILSLFRKQRWIICIAFALGQLLPRSRELFRKFLMAEFDCGIAIRILVEIPRNQLVHVYFHRTQDPTSVLGSKEPVAMAWRTMEQYDLVRSHASSSEHSCSVRSTVRTTPA